MKIQQLNMSFRWRSSIVSMVIVLCGGLWTANAQWASLGPPPWTNILFQTVGGITYFTHLSSPVHDCERVYSGPILRSGTNFTQRIEHQEFLEICTACFDCYHVETHVSVLGAIEPGSYRFTAVARSFSGYDSAYAQFNVTVPASEPTLTVSRDTNPISITLAGISNVTYTLQRSEDFTNWVAVATNHTASCVWNEPVSLNIPNRFYRVLIEGD